MDDGARSLGHDGSMTGRWVALALLAALYAFTLVAIAGYGFFALHPERLPDSDFARGIFTVAFGLFARLHIVVASAVLFTVLAWRLGFRWVVPFLLVSALAFLAEHIGTGYGVPFGGYSYSGLLGPKLGGRVPALIPMSWFLMALPAWVLAHATLNRPGAALGRVLLGSLWLVAWDLALDPAMSFLTPYWSWEASGAYYGMPWLNLFGWYLTGLLLMSTLEAFASRARWSDLDVRWMGGYYAAILLMPLGMLVAAAAWTAVLVTLLALGGLGAVSTALAARTDPAGRTSVPAGAVEA